MLSERGKRKEQKSDKDVFIIDFKKPFDFYLGKIVRSATDMDTVTLICIRNKFSIYEIQRHLCYIGYETESEQYGTSMEGAKTLIIKMKKNKFLVNLRKELSGE
jgi:hypothetical protein